MRIGLALLFILGCSCSTAWTQGPLQETVPSAIHLVGHEDALLLERVQEVIDDWDSRKLVNPYVMSMATVDEMGRPIVRKTLRRTDLNEFIADVEAAEALGKFLFWDMQVGSDFMRKGDDKYIGTACASCHYKHGMDARNRHTERIPYVVWDQYPQHKEHPLEFRDTPQPYDAVASATHASTVRADTPLHLIVGSQGVNRRLFQKLNLDAPRPGQEWYSEQSIAPTHNPKSSIPEEWEMFYQDHDARKNGFRQITSRNSPTVINAGFADRLFHDGRAESTFNGFSIFGDFDDQEVIYHRDESGQIKLVKIAILKAALASQAVGPIVNEVEMSYKGRTFVDVARKLLPAKILAYQDVSAQDPVLSNFTQYHKQKTYEDLIKRAFRREWWDSSDAHGHAQKVELKLARAKGEVGSLMEANFSLFWGLSLLIYQSELVSNNSPFDAMMSGNPQLVEDLWAQKRSGLEPIYLDRARTENPPPIGKAAPRHDSGSSVFQHGFRVFMNRGCIECHSGPLFSEVFQRKHEIEHQLPIAHALHNTLLPVTQSDSIALAAQKFHHRILSQVVNKLVGWKPGLERRAWTIAWQLDRQRADGHGNVDKLTDVLFVGPGNAIGLSKLQCNDLAKLLLRYETELANHLGGRPFFNEDERIAAVDLLVAGMLVERMPIPNLQANTRPPMPMAGPFPKQAYAFYDLGYYNLGVSPPRYDRGIGNSSEPSIEVAEEAITQAVNQFADIQSLLQGQSAREVVRQLQSDSSTLNAQQKEKLQQAVDATYEVLDSIRQSSGGVSGSAYRLRSSGGKFQRRLPRGLTEDAAAAPAATPSTPPSTPPVALTPEAFVDRSWDRIGLKSNKDETEFRRSEYHFLSRARYLVTNEEAWGLRKPFLHDNELSFWGSFKTPTLRNVELTGPYMHNGRLMGLTEVVDFYDDAGHVPRHKDYNPDKHPEIVELHMTGDDKLALQFFLMCLTDANVRSEIGLFSHPSLNLVNGYLSTSPTPNEAVVEVKQTP